MKRNREKTKEQLTHELADLHQRIAQVEASESEHKQVKTELEKAQQRLRTIFESVSDGVAFTDLELRIIDINEVGLRMFGYDHKGEIIGRSGLEFISPKEHARATVDMQNTLTKGHSDTLEYAFLDKKGTEFLAEYNVIVTKDESGGPAGFVATMRDITDRRRAEEALREAELKYRIVADNTYDWEWWLSPAGELIYSSPSCSRITGYDASELMDNAALFRTIIHSADLPVWDNHRCETSQGEVSPAIEFRILHRDGSERWIEHICQSVFDDTGKFQGSRGNNRDITERKQAEEALRESEEKFSKAFRSSPDPIGITSLKDRRMIEVNDSYLRYTGYTREEVIGTSTLELEIWADTGQRERIFQQLRQDSQVYKEEVKYRVKSGEVRTCLFSAELINIGGEPCILAVATDITERERAEAALRESEEKFSKVFHTSSHLMGITTPDEGIIFEINEAFCRVFGYTREEVIGHNTTELQIWADTEQRNRIIREFEDKGYVHNVEADARTKSGEIFTVVITVDSIVLNNKKYLLWVATDITERKKMEEEEQKIERLESIGTLAGGIAHDFNNLLTGIIGNISLAKRHIEPQGIAFERLDEAENASLKARDLTQQLLTFSIGGLPVKQVMYLGSLIRNSVTFTLRGSSVKPEFSLPDDIWVIEADEGQINQVIMNIAKNAVEAMPGGGILNVSARNRVIRKGEALPLSRGDYVEITIRDQGVGISKEYLPRIFEPYFTTKQRGSGLGLATAYSIIKNHGGYITVESEQNVGTTVYIHLPASKKQISKKKKEIVQPALIGQGRILVMDDEETIREFLHRALTNAGYEVELTGDGLEAISLYTRAKEAGQSFDAVIMDLTIPGGMGGKDVIGQLREIDPGVKAIVSSGYATDPIMSEYKKYGFSGVVAKPYRVAEIEKILRDLLSSSNS